jgi:hypothetical protein
MIAGYVTAVSLYLLCVAFLAMMPDEWIMWLTRRIVAFSITTRVIGTKTDENGEAVAIVEVDYAWYGATTLGAWNATMRFAGWLRLW